MRAGLGIKLDDMKHQNLNKSIFLFDQARKIIPSGCSTLAKSPLRLYSGYSPFYAESAKGSSFIDIDGNKWLDCEMAMGTIVWGYVRNEISQSIINQLSKGVSFSIPGKLEFEVAEKILNRIGKYKTLRFCKNGGDAVTAAVRLAKSKTNRQIVLYGAYHGWHDWAAYRYYGSKTALGISKYTAKDTLWVQELSTAHIERLIRGKERSVACIVVSPGNWTTSDLQGLQQLCRKYSIALIFDEVATFIRAGKKGFTGEKDIWPDLLCFSKGLANGLPLAVITGKEKYMKRIEDIKLSNTHSSELLALAAANVCEDLLIESSIWPSWKNMGIEIINFIRAYIKSSGLENILLIDGYYGCFRIHTPNNTIQTDPFREFFVKRLAQNGIFSTGYILLSDQHSCDDISQIKLSITQAIDFWKSKNS